MLKQVIDLFEILDDPDANGESVCSYLRTCGGVEISTNRVETDLGATDFVKLVVPGRDGNTQGGDAPTLGIVGRLGGLGARPKLIGFVSDGDGAWSALAAGAKLALMAARGDRLEGDVIVTTQVCPSAPIREHYPVHQMSSPVDQTIMNANEVLPEMDAILSLDTSKGHLTINHRGIAISNPVKQGYILKASYDLLHILATVTGKTPVTFPLSQQDITPYGNGLYHMNSILQPSTATDAPVVGVAIVAETAVAGCATGASHHQDVELAARFAVEVAKGFTGGTAHFIDHDEFDRLIRLYGDQSRFQKGGSTNT